MTFEHPHFFNRGLRLAAALLAISAASNLVHAYTSSFDTIESTNGWVHWGRRMPCSGELDGSVGYRLQSAPGISGPWADLPLTG